MRKRFVCGSTHSYELDEDDVSFLTTRITGAVLDRWLVVRELVDSPCLHDLITNDFRADTRCRDNRIERVSFFRHGHFQFRETSADFVGIFLRITDRIDEDLPENRS